MIKFILCLLIIHNNVAADDDYMLMREKLIKAESKRLVGQDLVLNEAEEKVSTFLIQKKQEELDAEVKSGISLQEINFLYARDRIEESEVYKIIQLMPKGAINHIHDVAMTDLLPIIKKWGYDDHLYVCFNEKLGVNMYKYAVKIVSDNPECKWKNVNEARKSFGNDDAFDQLIWEDFTMTQNDARKSKTQNDIWKLFQNGFISVHGFLSYEPVWVDYFHSALQDLIKDNVQFVEVRSVLPHLYDLNGNYKDAEYTFITLMEVDKKLRERQSEDYVGSKIIYAPVKLPPREALKKAVLTSIQLYENYKEYFSGFDLVGQEDLLPPLKDFIDILLLPKKMGKELPYLLHAGETDLQGSVDENLFDAILLNSTRIGHGFAISKHPYLKELAREKDIPIELCPVSNQVLGLVKDLRDHPASGLLAEDFPVTVSPDDPGLMGNFGASFDYYQVFMGMVPRNAGLKVLKKLILNSIRYSSLSNGERERLQRLWNRKWEKFINIIIRKYNL